MLKAVLFDLDHTLIDWEAAEPWEVYQARRLNNVHAYIDAHVHPLTDVTPEALYAAYLHAISTAWDQSRTTFIAPDLYRYLPEALVACGVPADRIDMDALLDAYGFQAITGERTFPDVPEVLPTLAEAGLTLGIITNASAPMTLRDRELAALDLLDHFPACRLTAADVGYIKPHRQIFLHALDQLGLAPDEAIYVGDNLEADIKGAQGVGMRGVLRVNDDPPAELEGVVPDAEIHTLHDLLPVLDAWYPGWRTNGKNGRNGHMGQDGHA